MIKKKLRVKILLWAMVLVLSVNLVSTFVVSVIVNNQNRKSVLRSSGKAMNVIKDFMVESNVELQTNIEYMGAMNKFGEDINFIKDFGGSKDLSMVIQSFVDLTRNITNTATIENFYSLIVYGTDSNPLCYIFRTGPEIFKMGYHFDKVFYTKVFEQGTDYRQIKEVTSQTFNGSLLSSEFGDKMPEGNRVSFVVDGGFLGVKVVTPIYANEYNQKTEKIEPNQVGFIVAVKQLKKNFIARVGEMTGMKMNLFVNDTYSVGDFPNYKKAFLFDIPKSVRPEWLIKDQTIFFKDIKLGKNIFFQANLPFYRKGEFIGCLSLLQSDKIVKANTRQMIILLSIVACCCLGVVIPIAYFAAGKVVKPIIEIKDKLKDIAEGDGDLTARIDVKSSDEIGQVAEWFNTFIDKIHDLISAVADNSDELNKSFKNLNDIAKIMSDGADQTSMKASAVSAAGEEMSMSMNSMAVSMEQASENMGMVSAATEIMVSTFNEISKNTVEAKEITNEVVLQTLDASSQLEKLGKAADEIGGIIQIITGISDQVNLLALNATIEAARAGEAGKGFAVVANEIKELAKQTAAATAEIKEKIEKISMTTIVTARNASGISEVVNRISKIVIIIADAVKEQSATTQNISENIIQGAQGINQVSENISQGSVVSTEIANDIGDVTETAKKMTSQSIQINNQSKELSKLSDKLKGLVNKFKL